MADAAPSAQTEKSTPQKRSGGKLLVMISVPLLLLAGGLYFYLTSGRTVSTDNAYIQQHKVSVAAEVGGRIVEVAVKENQHVKKGDLLFRIDPAPYRLAMEQATADIAAAEAKVSTLETTADTTQVDIAAAREAVGFAQRNLDREAALMKRGFNTRARMDAAEHALAQARAALANAEAAAVRARAQLATGSAAPGINPGILAGRVKRDRAAYDMQRTEIRAPADGIISQADRLQVGQTIVAGLPAVSIVVDGQSWIEANFKETDLGKMQPGQPATITIDAYPDLDLHGHVASIGAGTGSEFSVLPAQNASGNWVKVTQRIPVRIAIDGQSKRPLIAGMSTKVRVRVDGAH